MSGVCGQYAKQFSEASHIVAEGHLDDPSFREIAISPIRKVNSDSVTAFMGWRLGDQTFAIERHPKRGEYVVIEFTCPIFGKQRTQGWPFIDEKTAKSNLDRIDTKENQSC